MSTQLTFPNINFTSVDYLILSQDTKKINNPKMYHIPNACLASLQKHNSFLFYNFILNFFPTNHNERIKKKDVLRPLLYHVSDIIFSIRRFCFFFLFCLFLLALLNFIFILFYSFIFFFFSSKLSYLYRLIKRFSYTYILK